MEQSALRCKLTVVHEKGVVSTGSNDSDLDTVFGIPSSETVENAVDSSSSSADESQVDENEKKRTH